VTIWVQSGVDIGHSRREPRLAAHRRWDEMCTSLRLLRLQQPLWLPNASSMCARAIARCTVKYQAYARPYSSSLSLRKANVASGPRPIDPRWLSGVKQRIGKCITFGLTSEQLDEAGAILQQLASTWTELLAGSEGYLTAPGRVGLAKQAVVWGEMVCRPTFCTPNTLDTADQGGSAAGHNGMPFLHFNWSLLKLRWIRVPPLPPFQPLQATDMRKDT
jgi:hypothetical protein